MPVLSLPEVPGVRDVTQWSVDIATKIKGKYNLLYILVFSTTFQIENLEARKPPVRITSLALIVSD